MILLLSVPKDGPRPNISVIVLPELSTFLCWKKKANKTKKHRNKNKNINKNKAKQKQV